MCVQFVCYSNGHSSLYTKWNVQFVRNVNLPHNQVRNRCKIREKYRNYSYKREIYSPAGIRTISLPSLDLNFNQPYKYLTQEFPFDERHRRRGSLFLFRLLFQFHEWHCWLVPFLCVISLSSAHQFEMNWLSLILLYNFSYFYMLIHDQLCVKCQAILDLSNDIPIHSHAFIYLFLLSYFLYYFYCIHFELKNQNQLPVSWYLSGCQIRNCTHTLKQ